MQRTTRQKRPCVSERSATSNLCAMADTPDEPTPPESTPGPEPQASVPAEPTPPASGEAAASTSSDPATSEPASAGKGAWLWAGGVVALAVIVAGIVFVLATRNTNTSQTAA